MQKRVINIKCSINPLLYDIIVHQKTHSKWLNSKLGRARQSVTIFHILLLWRASHCWCYTQVPRSYPDRQCCILSLIYTHTHTHTQVHTNTHSFQILNQNAFLIILLWVKYLCRNAKSLQKGWGYISVLWNFSLTCWFSQLLVCFNLVFYRSCTMHISLFSKIGFIFKAFISSS